LEKCHDGNSLAAYTYFVMTAPSREVLEEYVRPKLEQFLAARGLALSEAKNRIVHINKGFNFLGFTIRRFGRKVLTKPQKEKVEAHIGRLKAIVEEHQCVRAGGPDLATSTR
jgi:RNA-directed DNA polymerase